MCSVAANLNVGKASTRSGTWGSFSNLRTLLYQDERSGYRGPTSWTDPSRSVWRKSSQLRGRLGPESPRHPGPHPLSSLYEYHTDKSSAFCSRSRHKPNNMIKLNEKEMPIGKHLGWSLECLGCSQRDNQRHARRFNPRLFCERHCCNVFSGIIGVHVPPHDRSKQERQTSWNTKTEANCHPRVRASADAEHDFGYLTVNSTR